MPTQIGENRAKKMLKPTNWCCAWGSTRCAPEHRDVDRARYDAFQRLWNRYGIPELVTLKSDVFASLSASRPVVPADLAPPLDRAARALTRVALRQWRQFDSL
jgi:hypothetical protein